MSYDWDGLMELISGKYRPTWSSLCGGSDVKGVMELEDGKYKPVADAHGLCNELEGVMVNDGGKYFPRIVLENQYQCCHGEDCNVCNNILWVSGETPKQVQVVISGVTEAACSEGDPNGTYILTQMVGFPDTGDNFPCRWYAEPNAGGFFCYYFTYHLARSGVLVGTDNYWYFAIEHGTWCLSPPEYNNTFQQVACCSGFKFSPFGLGLKESAAYGGQAVVSWPIES